MTTKRKTILYAVFTIIIVIASIFANVSVFGSNTLFSVIIGDSMSPTLNNGDLVLLSKVKSNEVKLNDLVFIDNGNYSVIHRVVGYKYKENGNEYDYFYKIGDLETLPETELLCLITRGDKYSDKTYDNYNNYDEYIKLDNIKYKATKTYKNLGRPIEFIKKPINMFLLIILPIIILYSIIICELAIDIYKYKKEKYKNE